MRSSHPATDAVDQIITHGVHKGILHLYNEDDRLEKNFITVQGRKLVNFGSCSYLGLEFDSRLKQGACEAIDCYGTQFSASRAYISVRLYRELEELFEALFGYPCVIAPTTALGHIANLPVLVGERDVVLLDHQVHHSVQTAAQLVKARGVPVELLRHNRLDLLEERLSHLQSRVGNIWYLADGIYSMFGDACPVASIQDLLNRYPALRFYVDDAHGMSLYGRHGRGYVLKDHNLHPNMIMATSLAKAFATGGAVMVYPDRETARRVRTCSGPMITSGPLQPATLGAAVAAARIHLSPEIYVMQDELRENWRYAEDLIAQCGLPLVSKPGASVFFIGVSLPKLGYTVVGRMLEAGYYLNLGVFPAVPMKQAGIRFTVTRLHTKGQLQQMIRTLAATFFEALSEEGMTLMQIYQAFKQEMPPELSKPCEAPPTIPANGLTLRHVRSIDLIDQQEWDALFAGRGTFDWNGLRLLEATFKNRPEPENNWAFHYILIRDNKGTIVLATFLTRALWKDDMLSDAAVSSQVEEKRKKDRYYLTSSVLATGSLLTEGEHLYLDTSSPWRLEAFERFLKMMAQLQEAEKADAVVLRDFYETEARQEQLLLDHGFVPFAMPDTHQVHLKEWQDAAEFYQRLSRRSRQHFREDVRKHEAKFRVHADRATVTEEQLYDRYELYLNVKRHSLALNTFELPVDLFRQLVLHPGWETLVLCLSSAYTESGREEEVAVVWCYKTAQAFIPMIIGIDYRYNLAYKVYRQALYQLVLQGKALGLEKVLLGFSATTEKKKLGAEVIPVQGYLQTKDTFSQELLQGLQAARHKEGIS